MDQNWHKVLAEDLDIDPNSFYYNELPGSNVEYLGGSLFSLRYKNEDGSLVFTPKLGLLVSFHFGDTLNTGTVRSKSSDRPNYVNVLVQ